MKSLTKLLTLVVVFTLSTLNVAAVEQPSNISVDNITDTSLLLNWSTLEDASGYHIYYADTQDVEILTAAKREFITDMPLLIENLNPGTQYYFIVNGYDEIGEDGPFSEEVSFTTTGNQINNTDENIELNSSIDFKISNIEVLAQNQISLSFTSILENNEDSERIFKIAEKNDELMEYSIKDSKIDEESQNKILITFDELLPVNTEFKLTVISILDANGRNIESGIESFENFIIDEEKLNYVYQDEIGGIVIINEDNTTTILTSGTNQENDNNGIQYNDLGEKIDNLNNNQEVDSSNNQTNNSADNQVINEVEQGNNSVDNNEGNTGTKENEEVLAEGELPTNSEIEGDNMNGEEIAIDLLSAGQDAEVLPTTGPEHIFMLVLALVFGAMSFVFKFRKS